MIKFYFGGPYPKKDYIEKVAKQVELLSASYRVISTWHKEQGESGVAVEYSAKDMAEVVEADIFVMFNEQMYRHLSSGGMHTELGFALAAGNEVFIIGSSFYGAGCGINNFTSLAETTFLSVDDLLASLTKPEFEHQLYIDYIQNPSR